MHIRKNYSNLNILYFDYNLGVKWLNIINVDQLEDGSLNSKYLQSTSFFETFKLFIVN